MFSNEGFKRGEAELPDFGKQIAVDATPVHSHYNPDNKIISDPEAGWIVKEGNERKKLIWGFRLNLVVDANYELPIAKETTVYNQGEKAVVLPLLNEAKSEFAWFQPEAVICDKGYDSSAIY